MSFTSLAGTTGLIAPETAADLVNEINDGHAIPMQSGAVRLFFDPFGKDGHSRLMYLDSADGYVGRNYNRNATSTCSSTADYSAGGGCEPTVVIGIEGDSVRPNSKISNVRQFKVGWPSLTDWRWNTQERAFLVFTTDAISGCSTHMMNHGYAIWNGSQWDVQYETNGCPKLFKSAQAAFPLHIGGKRFKMYYSDPSQQTGRVTSSEKPWLGPKKLIYADGSADVVDFGDWEAQSVARDVVFLWPNGDTLDSKGVGYIDDYAYLTPTGSLDLQVMYLAITDSSIVPFPAAAMLLNP